MKGAVFVVEKHQHTKKLFDSGLSVQMFDIGCNMNLDLFVSSGSRSWFSVFKLQYLFEYTSNSSRGHN